MRRATYLYKLDSGQNQRWADSTEKVVHGFRISIKIQKKPSVDSGYPAKYGTIIRGQSYNRFTFSHVSHGYANIVFLSTADPWIRIIRLLTAIL